MSDDLGAQISQIYATPGSLEAFNDDIVAQFRSNGGEIVSGPLAGAPLLLLMLGQNILPLAYVVDENRYVIAASRGGSPDNPTWYPELLAAGEAIVEVGTQTLRVAVEEVFGVERDRLYAALAARLPIFDQYAARTTRVIPVMLLERRA
ncbi:MAG: nitroreductase/quinone reductase family protein [Sporichthyaceae bacterium]